MLGTWAAAVLASTVLPAWVNREIEVWKADWAWATVASAVTWSRLEATVTFFIPRAGEVRRHGLRVGRRWRRSAR